MIRSSRKKAVRFAHVSGGTSAHGAPQRRRLSARFGSLLRLLKPSGRRAWIPAVAAIALAAAAWIGWNGYRDGNLLTVTRVEVSGNRHWDASVLLEHAGIEVGQRLAEAPLRAGARRLLRLPGIRSATVRYLPGGCVRVTVREEDLVAIQGVSQGWRGLTADGSWIPLSGAAGLGEDAPILEERGLDARAEKPVAAFLASVRARHPDLFSGFSQVSLAPGGEADVYWRDGSMKVRLDYNDASTSSLDLLRELLRRERSGWREGTVVDLRVEGYAYVL